MSIRLLGSFEHGKGNVLSDYWVVGLLGCGTIGMPAHDVCHELDRTTIDKLLFI